jgi:hypothetical protein
MIKWSKSFELLQKQRKRNEYVITLEIKQNESKYQWIASVKHKINKKNQ